jgi:adenosylcobinamide-GDP ribazoletransferase
MRDFITALQFLTAIPIDTKTPRTEEDLARAVLWFPVAGLAVGGLLALLDGAADALGLFVWQKNIVILTAGIVITGAMHIDGLSDTVDGIACSRAGREDILRIMKDSRIGAMGAIAIVIDLLLRFLTLQCLDGPARIPGLVLAPALGRWCVVLAASLTPYARETGTGKTIFDTATSREAAIGLLAVTAAGIALCGFERALLAIGGAAASAMILREFFMRRIGGMTGDTLGAVNEAVEILVMNLLIMRH